VRVEVVLKDVGAKENGAKTWTTWKYSLAHQGVKLWNKHLWLEDHVGEMGLSSNWPTKLGLAKKPLPIGFPNCLLQNVLVKFVFPYVVSPHHEKAKWNTIRVTRGASAKLPHYTSLALVYPMENEMSFVHYIVKQWGCDYSNKDGKGLNERTQGHPMLKPKSKMMQVD